MVGILAARSLLRSILGSAHGVKRVNRAAGGEGNARKVVFSFGGRGRPLGPYSVPLSALSHLSTRVSRVSRSCGVLIRMQRLFHTGYPINR